MKVIIMRRIRIDNRDRQVVDAKTSRALAFTPEDFQLSRRGLMKEITFALKETIRRDLSDPRLP